MQLRNGETIEFFSYKFKSTLIKINLKGGGNVKQSVENILGYYDIQTEEQFIFKSGEVLHAHEDPYFFDKLMIEGSVSIYGRRRKGLIIGSSINPTTGMATANQIVPSNSTICLEKNSVYQEFDEDKMGKRNRNERKIKLLDFVGDEPSIVKEVESEDFKCNDDDIERIVKKYNLLKYKNTSDKSFDASVFFYVKSNKSTPDTVRITVNDEQEIILDKKKINPLELSNKYDCKVCVNNYCETMKASHYFIKYIEISFKENEIRFTQKHSADANFYIKDLYNK